jgi:PKD repeat protein
VGNKIKIFLLVGFIILISIKLKANMRYGAVPVADFEVSNLCYKSIASFSNTSTNLQNQVFEWTIMQMGVSAPIYTSTATNITFQFPVKTTYTVSLAVINYITPTHTHSDFVQRVIFIDSIPIANFDWKGCHDKFANLSCCSNSFTWSFGDSSPTSTVISPVHSYSASNFYTVSLTAGNGTLSDTVSESIFTFNNFLTASFTFSLDPDSVNVRSDYDFKSDYDSLAGSTCNWNWAFGDGQTLAAYGTPGWITKHKYPAYERDSTYIVFLLVKDICYSAFSQKNILIKGVGKTVIGTTVFPSPVVYGYLNIESSEKDNLIEIKLIDCLGKRLDNLTVYDKPYGYYLWIGNISSGIYTVQLVFKDRIENHKIIKE